MKKFLSLILASLMTVSMAAAVSAIEGGEAYGEVPVTGVEVVIDGKLDAIYQEGLTIDLNAATADGIAVGTVTLLWNGVDTIYAAFEVEDSTAYLLPDVPNPRWDADYVEFFLDYSNTAARAYDQYLIDRQNNACLSCDGTYSDDAAALAGYGLIASASSQTDNGYILEMQLLAYADTIAAGKNIGVFAGICDFDAEGGKLGNTYCVQDGMDINKYGYITLTDNIVNIEPEVTDSAAAGETAPQTFDAGMIALASAVLSAVGYAVSKKR